MSISTNQFLQGNKYADASDKFEVVTSLMGLTSSIRIGYNHLQRIITAPEPTDGARDFGHTMMLISLHKLKMWEILVKLPDPLIEDDIF